MIKSPFIIVKNFLSPLECETVINSLNLYEPEIIDNKVKKTVVTNKLLDMRVSPKFESVIDLIENYYTCKIDGLTPFEYIWYPTNFKSENAMCENAALVDGKWLRTNQHDFLVTIVLNDHQEKIPFDPSFEVKGGRLEFPTHQFSFLPQRGTLIVHPANQNFVYGVSSVEAGDLYQIKTRIMCETLYTYDPEKFQGSYKLWFK